jgi:HEAT repeat protein
MLKNLYEIDWSRLTHPFGDACDIPDLIRDLATDDEDARADAREMLSYRVCRESPIETVAAAVPFLIELAAHPDVEERGEILAFLAEIADDGADDEPHGAPAEPRRPAVPEEGDRALQRARDLAWSGATREAVESGLETFLELLTDEDPKARLGAARVLATCRGRTARLIPEVAARIPGQEAPRVQAALLLALDALVRSAGPPGSVNAFFEEWMRPKNAPVVRLTAALCLARSSPGMPSPEIVDTLCEAAEAAWSDFEDASGRSIAFSVGWALREAPEARLRFLSGPLDSPDPWVRASAQAAAAQLAHDSRSIARPVAAALGERLVDAKHQDRSRIVALLSGFGATAAEAVEPLAAALDDADHRIRTDAALALAGLHDLRALPVLIERLQSYLPPGDSSRPVDRDRRGARPPVGPMGADEDFPRIAEAVGGLGAEARAAVPTFVDLLRGPPGAAVHGRYRPAEIARALGRIGPEARPAISALVALMRDRPEARTAAATAIGRIGGPEARAAAPLLEEWLRSPGEWQRAVAEALRRIDGDPGAQARRGFDDPGDPS